MRGPGTSAKTDRVGIPSTASARNVGALPLCTQHTVHGNAYSTPVTASAARRITREPSGTVDAQLTSTAAALTLRISTARMVPSMVELLKRDKADIPEDVIAKFIPEFRAEMQKALPQITELYARVYAKHFTLQELQDVAKFYESPLGRKLIAETPLILKETLPIAQQWGEKVGQQAAINAIAKLRAQGVKI